MYVHASGSDAQIMSIGGANMLPGVILAIEYEFSIHFNRRWLLTIELEHVHIRVHVHARISGTCTLERPYLWFDA